MASERQIAANRANASKSTGPRSRSGRKRAAGNATVHGLTANVVIVSTPALAEQVEQLAREIAGSTDDAIILQHARDAAWAEIDLARVRRMKVAHIARGSAFGTLEHEPLFRNVRDVREFFRCLDRGEPWAPSRPDPLATMPAEEAERTAEALRRALPDLVKLGRYESRAASRRDKAIRRITKSLRDRN
jgi:hypothetical protein